ncbi:hypothetical protein PanWU01x14_214130 [Parasponia andersonii]|uniref:KIB1-4 beta-propeller domain-containing protein n=1 Tax=Parasponia andersonii TaxID=3476 RepID=A0A2P5BSD9_PARAD|nr:hypothetical protein PanWU01x14_214130 [Parasponia andersonii]
MLLVPSESKDNDEWNVYSVLENRFLPSKLVFSPYDRPFSGSSEGWILTLDEDSVVTLYKPFAEKNEENIIHLPPLFSEADAQLYADVREFRIMKMTTFTPNPVTKTNDLIIVVICGEFHTLAFIRPAKDSTWTFLRIRVKLNESLGYHTSFEDVVYYRDKFYALTIRGGVLASFNINDSFEFDIKSVTDGISSDIEEENEEVVVVEEDDVEVNEEEEEDVEVVEEDVEVVVVEEDDIEVNEEEEGVEVIIEEEEEEEDDDDDEFAYYYYKRYLVESSGGDLLQVKRYRQWNNNHVTVFFRVFKLSADLSRWVEMKTLGEDSLFLGDNSSISVLASKYVGCPKNCIYFTHDKDVTSYSRHGPWDLGVYDLESGLCTRGFNIDAALIAKMVGRSPIWVLPTF